MVRCLAAGHVCPAMGSRAAALEEVKAAENSDTPEWRGLSKTVPVWGRSGHGVCACACVCGGVLSPGLLARGPVLPVAMQAFKKRARARTHTTHKNGAPCAWWGV